MLNIGSEGSFRRDMTDDGKLFLEMLYVVNHEADLRAGFGAASLERRASRKDAHHLHAKVREDSGNGTTEAGAVGEEDDDCRDAPRHAEHGERGLAAIVLQRLVGLSEEIVDHWGLLLPQRFH